MEKKKCSTRVWHGMLSIVQQFILLTTIDTVLVIIMH